MRSIYKLIMGVGLGLLSLHLQAQVIPASRTVSYSRVGYNGPQRPNPSTVLTITSAPYNAPSNNTGNCVTAFNAAVTALGGNPGVIYFPSGTFRFTGPITVPEGVIIRGNGAANTTLSFDLGTNGATSITVGGSAASGYIPLTGGYSKGSTTVSVASTTGFAVGDWVVIRQNNIWDTNPTTVWAPKSLGQMLQIESVTSTTLTFSEPLMVNFRASQSPEIGRTPGLRQNVGLENFRITRLADAAGLPYGIFFNWAANCWIRGVESDRSASGHIAIYQAAHIEVGGCYVEDGYLFTGSGTRGYGVTMGTYSTNCLVENNVFRRLRHHLIVKEGCVGNVLSYNYTREPNRSEFPSDGGSDMMMHGFWPAANLFEGNVGMFGQSSETWGPAGPHNTYFRNRMRSYGWVVSTVSTCCPSTLQTDSINFVGNEITGTGNSPICGGLCPFGNNIWAGANHLRHGNILPNGNIDPSGTTTLTEKSMYLTSQPSWWTGTDVWGGIGVPNTLNSNTIPAERRWNAGGDLTVPYTPFSGSMSFTATGFHNLAGSYTNVSIPSGTTVVLSDDIFVSGTLSIGNGGRLICAGNNVRGTGNFILSAGGTLSFANAAGLTASGTTGAVQVSGTRSYSNDAHYIFNNTANAVTGAGFPSLCRTLTLERAQVTISAALGVRQGIFHRGTGNLVAGTNLLTLRSNATEQCHVNLMNTGTVTGTVIVQRYVSGNNTTGVRHFSSPVTSTNVQDLINSPTMGSNLVQLLNETVNTGVGSSWQTISTVSTVLTPARGYAYTVAPFSTIDLAGTLNTGNVTINITRTGTNGWNLIGNPYPSVVNWDLVTADVAYPTLANVSKARYYWVARSTNSGFWAAYVNGMPAQRRFIPAMQGFLVRAMTVGTHTITFKNAHRVTENVPNPNFASRVANPDTRAQISMEIAENGITADESYIYFQQGATALFDDGMDASRISNSGPSIYSQVASQAYSINGLPPLTGTENIALGVRVNGQATLKFNPTNLDAFDVFLIDNVAGTIQNLKTNPEYVVNGNGLIIGRFSIQFSPLNTTQTASTLVKTQLEAWPNPVSGSELFIRVPNWNEAKPFEAELFDLTGKSIRIWQLVEQTGTDQSRLGMEGIKAGVYTLKVSTENGVLNQKITVQ